MNHDFQPFINWFTILFGVNILVYFKTTKKHKEYLGVVFKHFERCEFWLDWIVFQRYIITKDGISVDPTTIETVVNWWRLTNITEIRSLLGLASYYRQFMNKSSCFVAL